MNEPPINNFNVNSKVKKASLKSTIIINNVKQDGGHQLKNKNKKDIFKIYAGKDLIKIK